MKSSYVASTPFAHIMYEKLQEYDNLVAFIDGATQETLTYREVFVKSVQLASALRRLGMKMGCDVTIISENDINYFIPYLACLYNGYSLHHLNPDYTTYELERYMRMTQPKIVFTSQRVVRGVVALQSQFPQLQTIVTLNGNAAAAADDFISLETLCKLGDVDGFTLAELDPFEQVACIFNSSGTTGLPKGVMLTHDNLKCMLAYAQPEYNIGVGAHFATICNVPNFHVFGTIISFPTLLVGGRIVMLSKFVPELYLSTIERHAVEKLYLVPPLAAFLVKSELVNKYNLKSIKCIICGAAPLPPQVAQLLQQRLGVRVCNMYGLTETSGPLVFNPMTKDKHASVGVLLDNIEAKVINPENGSVLQHNDVGELCFRGRCIMKGYRNEPEKTAEIIDDDGYLHTGDYGYIDDDNFIYIIDRIKDIIKYKGFQVSPSEIEGVIMTYEAVKDVAVAGLVDERAGEIPIAFVVLKPDHSATEDEIRTHVSKYLSAQKHIHRALFVDDIPKNPSGKILKRLLRDKYSHLFTSQ